jgi:hypothetical protein
MTKTSQTFSITSKIEIILSMHKNLVIELPLSIIVFQKFAPFPFSNLKLDFSKELMVMEKSHTVEKRSFLYTFWPIWASKTKIQQAPQQRIKI